MKIIASAIILALILTFVSCKKTNGDDPKNTESINTSDSINNTEPSTNASDITSEINTSPVNTDNTDDSSEGTSNVPDTSSPDNNDKVYTDEYLKSLDNTKSGYGQGVNLDSANRPTGAIIMQERYGEYGGVFIEPDNKDICLSFDLGYEYNGLTGKILDTLNEKGVKGVFFATMHYVKSNPEFVKRIIDEGHVLANHSVNHKSMPTLTIDEMKSEIMGLHNYIKENYNYEMWLFRPPAGEFSACSLAVAKSLGYSSILWSYAYYDYDTSKQPSIQEGYNKVTAAAHGGAIYLLHACSETNAAILGDVIDYFKTNGYSFQTLDKYK